ncbi:hypothetical protein D9756_011282 [Leucocoprinus leucothites]|uniref:Uncharacterized protein n=1 Tax=Leucocoprinus leucothites TaxID=201217 RepID=A0A8H5CP26_9AGAR|nr:hypothetical protein D9756_011282 [Leucoagaricus leucothites]
MLSSAEPSQLLVSLLALDISRHGQRDQHDQHPLSSLVMPSRTFSGPSSSQNSHQRHRTPQNICHEPKLPLCPVLSPGRPEPSAPLCSPALVPVMRPQDVDAVGQEFEDRLFFDQQRLYTTSSLAPSHEDSEVNRNQSSPGIA